MTNSFLVFFCFAGKTTQVLSNFLDNKLREDLERLKKIRAHRGLRHYWGIKLKFTAFKLTVTKGRRNQSGLRKRGQKRSSLHSNFPDLHRVHALLKEQEQVALCFWTKNTENFQ